MKIPTTLHSILDSGDTWVRSTHMPCAPAVGHEIGYWDQEQKKTEYFVVNSVLWNFLGDPEQPHLFVTLEENDPEKQGE